MGMCSEWHNTLREISAWRRGNQPIRASCHVSILQSPICVMAFWTHAKCLLAFISYIPMFILAKHTIIITVRNKLSYEMPICRHKALMFALVFFWTVCMRPPHVLSLPSRHEKSESWGTVRVSKNWPTHQISLVERTVKHWVSGCAPTTRWKYSIWMQNWQIKPLSALWKPLLFEYRNHRGFEWEEWQDILRYDQK